MRPSTSHLFGAVGEHHNEDDYGGGGCGGGDDDTFDNDSHPSHREAVVGSLDRVRGPTPTITHAELDEPYVLPAGWSAHLDDAGTGGVYYCFEPSGYTTWDPPPSDHQSGRRTSSSSSSAPHSQQQPQPQHLEKHWQPGEHTHPVDHDSHATSSTSTLATQDYYSSSSSAPTAAPSAGSSGPPPTRSSTASPLVGNKPALAEMQEAKAKAETVRRAFEAALRAPLNADSDGRTSEHQQGSQHEQQRQQHAQEQREQEQREQHQRGGSEYHHSPPEQVHELPPGWSSHVDDSNGNAYYCFEPSGYVTWDHPSTQQQQQQQQTPQHHLPSAAETHPPSSHPHHTRKSRDGGGDDDDDDDKDDQDDEGREGVTLSPPRLPHATLRRAPSRSSLARYESQLQPALGASSFSPPTEKQLREKRCEDAFRAASQHAMDLHRASAGLPEMMRPPPLSRRGAPPPPHTYLSPQQVAELEGLPPLKPPWVRGVHRHRPADSSACLYCLYFFNTDTGASTWDEPFECSPNAI